jgi:Kef-type K+ transport system membrane component KefB
MEHGVGAATWAALASIILAAKLGGELALRLRQPAVLGELLAGVLLGNLGLLGEAARAPEIAFAAELGVLLLLFQVGLESSLGEMVRIAPRAGAVATLGVVFPSLLGVGASKLVLPEQPWTVHLFVGATLCATSVGITAAVLKDRDALGSEEAKIILGAAVIDDVLGLVVLAIVSAVAASGAMPPVGQLLRISGVALGFVLGAVVIGLWLTRGVYRVASVLRAPHVLGAVSIALCLLFASASAGAGLAAIVGAYAAGLVLDEVTLRPLSDKKLHHVEDFVAPIAAVFAPVFFARTGMNVKLGRLGAESLLLVGLLVVAAVVGKLACGLGVRGRGLDRLTIGFGMTPRGEVGLIFAAVGAHLVVDGKPVFSDTIYAALVAAVFVTTLVGPPALAARLGRLRASREKLETRGAGAA